MGTTKISHICLCIDFWNKVLHDFEVKNSVYSNKRIELSDIQVVLIMSWLSVSSFVFSLDRKLYFNLGFVLNSFRCSKGDVWDMLCWQLGKWIHKIVVGKSWMIKLRKIDTEDMENELACDSNDYLYLLFVFTFRSVRLTRK